MILTEPELETLCHTAKQAAVAAGQYIQSQFDKHYDKTQKDGGDSKASQVVTAVDLKAQEIILKYLQPTIEQHDLGLLTEEAADDQSRLEKPYFWCIDPMDGTLPFTESRTGYAVSIALITQSGDPVIGVVYVPDLEACYAAIKGSGVWLNDQPFMRKEEKPNDTLHVYMGRSLKTTSYFDQLTNQLNDWASERNMQLQYCDGFGAVRNALGVMTSGHGCYFKFPKKRKGGGSIWDFAATRLFFEELGLHVSDAQGERLHLNNPETTFMHQSGVIYSTHAELSDFIISLNH